jgi:hypothetical protein
VLTHVVFFTLPDPTAAPELAARMRSMAGRVPTLRELEIGVDEIESPRSAHICLISRFDDTDGLAAYAVHPVHLEVLAAIKAAGATTVKVDYTAP